MVANTGNPLIKQGVLNRILASLQFDDFPELNITAPFLGKAGLSFGFNGPRTTTIDTMTGVVQSPEPYVPFAVVAGLLRTQPLALTWQQQEQSTTLLGSATLRPDVPRPGALASYSLSNCALIEVRELPMAGLDAGYPVVITGIYYINQALWNG